MAVHGWVVRVDGGVVLVHGYEVGGPDVRLSISLPMRHVRPTERAHLTDGTYVVFELCRGPRNAPHRRFPLRLARVGRWTEKEVDDAKEEGRRLSEALRDLAEDTCCKFPAAPS